MRHISRFKEDLKQEYRRHYEEYACYCASHYQEFQPFLQYWFSRPNTLVEVPGESEELLNALYCYYVTVLKYKTRYYQQKLSFEEYTFLKERALYLIFAEVALLEEADGFEDYLDGKTITEIFFRPSVRGPVRRGQE